MSHKIKSCNFYKSIPSMVLSVFLNTLVTWEGSPHEMITQWTVP